MYLWLWRDICIPDVAEYMYPWLWQNICIPDCGGIQYMYPWRGGIYVSLAMAEYVSLTVAEYMYPWLWRNICIPDCGGIYVSLTVGAGPNLNRNPGGAILFSKNSKFGDTQHKYELGGISPGPEGHKRPTCTVPILCPMQFLAYIWKLYGISQGQEGHKRATCTIPILLYVQCYFLHKYELGGISPGHEGHKRSTCTVPILCPILFLA